MCFAADVVVVIVVHNNDVVEVGKVMACVELTGDVVNAIAASCTMNLSVSPASSTYFCMMAFAAGERQMLPRQMKRIFVLSISFCDDCKGSNYLNRKSTKWDFSVPNISISHFPFQK